MYNWNEPPQPQMVEFCDLVRVGIVPVSKKLLLSTNAIFELCQFLCKKNHLKNGQSYLWYACTIACTTKIESICVMGLSYTKIDSLTKLDAMFELRQFF